MTFGLGVNGWGPGEQNCDHLNTCECCDFLVQVGTEKLVKEAEAKGFAAGIEAAAKVADADLGAQPGLVAAPMRFDGGASEATARRIAGRIRSLLSPPVDGLKPQG